jgi:hypothetical protein
MPKERADQEHIPETQLDQALPERLLHCKNAGNSCKKNIPEMVERDKRVYYSHYSITTVLPWFTSVVDTTCR